MTLFFHFSRKLGSPFFNVFPALELVSFSSLLEELATQEKSTCTGHFLSYVSVNHVFPDLLHQVLSSSRENSLFHKHVQANRHCEKNSFLHLSKEASAVPVLAPQNRSPQSCTIDWMGCVEYVFSSGLVELLWQSLRWYFPLLSEAEEERCWREAVAAACSKPAIVC